MTGEPSMHPRPQALADWLAWLEREAGARPCTCRYEWRSLGRLYGSSMGKGWVRMNTEQGCLEHDPGAPYAPFFLSQAKDTS